MATTVLSDLDRDLQRADALRKANRIRIARGQLRRDLQSQRIAIGRVLLDPPPCVESMKIFDLLTATPGLGPAHAHNLLYRMRFPVVPTRRVGDMTEGQRVDLTNLIRKTRGVTRSGHPKQ